MSLIWFNVRFAMLLVLFKPATPWKITVSPLVGVPIEPQLALLSQSALAPPPPVQTSVLAWLSATKSRLAQVRCSKVRLLATMQRGGPRRCHFKYSIGAL